MHLSERTLLYRGINHKKLNENLGGWWTPCLIKAAQYAGKEKNVFALGLTQEGMKMLVGMGRILTPEANVYDSESSFFPQYYFLVPVLLGTHALQLPISVVKKAEDDYWNAIKNTYEGDPYYAIDFYKSQILFEMLLGLGLQMDAVLDPAKMYNRIYPAEPLSDKN